MTDPIRGLPDSFKLPHEAQHHTVTPYFKHMSVLNVAQSQIKGRAVYDLKEVVEMRLAGDRNYSPIVPADSMYRRVGDRVVTFAERWADQYAQFIQGDEQTAKGTALEMLIDYGITPAQLSICRALKIYSIEALHALDGHNAKNLGMNANALKAMARRYMEERPTREAEATSDKVSELMAKIAELEAKIALPAVEASPEEIDEAVAVADDEYAALSDADLKARIRDLSGATPRGNPSRQTLVESLRELEGA